MRNDDGDAIFPKLVMGPANADQFKAFVLKALDDLFAVPFHVYKNTHLWHVGQAAILALMALLAQAFVMECIQPFFWSNARHKEGAGRTPENPMISVAAKTGTGGISSTKSMAVASLLPPPFHF